MKVKVLEEKRGLMGEFSTKDFLPGKIYTAELDESKNHWYRIIDESGEDYLYLPDIFEIIER